MFTFEVLFMWSSGKMGTFLDFLENLQMSQISICQEVSDR